MLPSLFLNGTCVWCRYVISYRHSL